MTTVIDKIRQPTRVYDDCLQAQSETNLAHPPTLVWPGPRSFDGHQQTRVAWLGIGSQRALQVQIKLFIPAKIRSEKVTFTGHEHHFLEPVKAFLRRKSHFYGRSIFWGTFTDPFSHFTRINNLYLYLEGRSPSCRQTDRQTDAPPK